MLLLIARNNYYISFAASGLDAANADYLPAVNDGRLALSGARKRQ